MYRVSQDVQLKNEPFDPSKINILNFPEHPLEYEDDLEFVINNRNKIRGTLKVILITPSSDYKDLPLQLIDTENYLVSYRTNEIGKFSIFIKFNEFDLSKKPLTVTVAEKVRDFVLPVFNSDSRKVDIKGLGIQQVTLDVKNEFTVDASAAGNNILFVSVGGPTGQCDEVFIRHIGQNIYNVYYRAREGGEYRIVVKYGSDHIPGSPFHLRTS